MLWRKHVYSPAGLLLNAIEPELFFNAVGEYKSNGWPIVAVDNAMPIPNEGTVRGGYRRSVVAV